MPSTRSIYSGKYMIGLCKNSRRMCHLISEVPLLEYRKERNPNCIFTNVLVFDPRSLNNPSDLNGPDALHNYRWFINREICSTRKAIYILNAETISSDTKVKVHHNMFSVSRYNYIYSI